MQPPSNISALVTTVAPYLPIAELFVDHARNLDGWELPSYLVCNKFPANYDKTPLNGFSLIDAGVELNTDGHHYIPTVTHALELIQTDYVLLFLDDFMIQMIRWDRIYNQILPYMMKYDYTQTTFQGCPLGYEKFTPVEIDDFGVDSSWAYNIEATWPYKNSSQAALWDRKKLLTLLEMNSHMNLHHWDAMGDAKEPDGTKRLATNNKINKSDIGWNKTSTIMQYIEICRWGGFSPSEFDVTVPYIRTLIDKYKLGDDPRYQTFIDTANKESSAVGTGVLY